MLSLAVRGDGASRGLRSRPHHNDPPPRPAVPGGNVRTPGGGGRLAMPARPTMPTQGRPNQGRPADRPVVAEPTETETAILPAVTDPGEQSPPG
ncbi:hypothetical protein GSF22_31830, partial [Micromonospora echinofusca]|nr:hypothetical protein [Micromonospora echinofusca]